MKTDWTPEGNRYSRIIADAQRVRAERQAAKAPLFDASQRFSLALHDLEVEQWSKTSAERAIKCAATREAKKRPQG